MFSVLRRGASPGRSFCQRGFGEHIVDRATDCVAISPIQSRSKCECDSACRCDFGRYPADIDSTLERRRTPCADWICECLKPAVGEGEEPQAGDRGSRGTGSFPHSTGSSVRRRGLSACGFWMWPWLGSYI